ncbi:unnamed protein product [Pleuronectes platessa]|uniref:Uncharacterized protein n=1 Tax=Pleuronectes platessa TaxID=8262 RepID=A0A9N7V0K7_PLEPL|nr:unnamed protein product [Pleuronectes platessa]
MDACPPSSLDHLLLSTQPPPHGADIISMQPASSPPVASHKGALGALVVDPSHAMDHATMPPSQNVPALSGGDRQPPPADTRRALEKTKEAFQRRELKASPSVVSPLQRGGGASVRTPTVKAGSAACLVEMTLNLFPNHATWAVT